jgi:hypothetical protein
MQRLVNAQTDMNMLKIRAPAQLKISNLCWSSENRIHRIHARIHLIEVKTVRQVGRRPRDGVVRALRVRVLRTNGLDARMGGLHDGLKLNGVMATG